MVIQAFPQDLRIGQAQEVGSLMMRVRRMSQSTSASIGAYWGHHFSSCLEAQFGIVEVEEQEEYSER